MSRNELSSCRNEEHRLIVVAIEELESFLTQVKHDRAKVALQPLPVVATPKQAVEKDTAKKRLLFRSSSL